MPGAGEQQQQGVLGVLGDGGGQPALGALDGGEPVEQPGQLGGVLDLGEDGADRVPVAGVGEGAQPAQFLVAVREVEHRGEAARRLPPEAAAPTAGRTRRGVIG